MSGNPPQVQTDPAPTLQVLEHRGLERWLVRAMKMARAMGLSITNLDPDSVLTQARRSTGLEDWGDERFLEPMRRMLSAVPECEYTILGDVLFRGNTYRAVTHRLQIEAFFARHPEAEAIPVDRPVFVLGFPRTGTTLLQNLLALPEGRRALQFWELVNPAPWTRIPTGTGASASPWWSGICGWPPGWVPRWPGCTTCGRPRPRSAGPCCPTR